MDNCLHPVSGGGMISRALTFASSSGIVSTGAGRSILGIRGGTAAAWVMALISVVQPAHFLARLVRLP